jgi:lipoyl(octanoyl) transferase
MIRFEDLGTITYEEAELKQLATFEKGLERVSKGEAHEDTIYILEHQPVYTLGKNGKEEHILPIARTSGATFHRISRGGDITFHGPGQIVAYPILDLRKLGIGIAQYVATLEKIGQEICSHYGIETTTIPSENGVWIDADNHKARKIMAIGIKASRYITMHGLAFNVNTDLRFFEYIIPCGIVGKGVTSLEKELGHPVDIQEVKNLFQTLFSKYFNK